MKYAKDVRDEWKQYLYLWANGPLCSKGKPHGFGKSPSADLAAAVITAIRAFPTRVQIFDVGAISQPMASPSKTKSRSSPPWRR